MKEGRRKKTALKVREISEREERREIGREGRRERVK